VSNELMSALEQIEKDQGIPKAEIITMVEQALVSAYRKHAGQMVNVVATIDTDSGQISAYVVKAVVETVTNPLVEITAAEAARVSHGVVEGAELRIPVDARDFARIAAQTAKQVLTQKVRETQRETLYTEYKPKEGTMINGTVLRFLSRNIVVDLGRGSEAMMPVREQVRREHWAVSDRIRALILKVERSQRGPEIILSRAHPDFVKRLFEQEVPEIYEKTVEVVSVVREAGFRSKVVVRSNNPKVDPVGACVGVKGSRVRPIINELQGERIDLVAHTLDTSTFIGNAMSPVKPLMVRIISHVEKRAEVLVADDQLSLAIGKSGQNVRLANKLTGWSLDVRSEGQKREAAQANAQAAVDELSQLEGVGPKTAEALQKGGWADVSRLADAKPDDLTALSGIGEKSAERIIEAAQAFLTKKSEGTDEPAEETAVEVPAEPVTDGAPESETRETL
jgi:N utilization substance protein A